MDKNVICMKWGDKFDADYVNRLYDMVERNLKIPHRFVCFTDNAEGINPNVEIREIPPLNEEGIPDRMWKKLTVFNEKLADLQGQALFLDLDIIIRDDLTPFFEAEGEFLIIKDWDFPHDIIGNSSVFRFEIGKHPDIIEHFYQEGKDIRKRYKNEQAFLTYEMYRKGILKYWDKNWCVSFKCNCLHKFPLCWFKVPRDPEESKILIFHGKPTPKQAYEGYFGKCGFRYIKPTRWLEKYWTGVSK